VIVVPDAGGPTIHTGHCTSIITGKVSRRILGEYLITMADSLWFCKRWMVVLATLLCLLVPCLDVEVMVVAETSVASSSLYWMSLQLSHLWLLFALLFV